MQSEVCIKMTNSLCLCIIISSNPLLTLLLKRVKGVKLRTLRVKLNLLAAF